MMRTRREFLQTGAAALAGSCLVNQEMTAAASGGRDGEDQVPRLRPVVHLRNGADEQRAVLGGKPHDDLRRQGGHGDRLLPVRFLQERKHVWRKGPVPGRQLRFPADPRRRLLACLPAPGEDQRPLPHDLQGRTAVGRAAAAAP